MLRTPDGIVEKVSVQDDVLDCAPYMSKSGMTFSGCFQVKRGNVLGTRGLYKLYGEPLFTFETRAKITRDYDRMEDLIKRFIREFSIYNALIYFDNFTIRAHDVYKKSITLEDTPYYMQGHLFIYRLKLSVELSTERKTMEEKLLDHMITFSNSVSTYHELDEDVHISPGYGFFVQSTEDITANISSPDHGEIEVSLPAGQWLFLHSPPRRDSD